MNQLIKTSISVIVPIYNLENVLKKCLTSLEKFKDSNYTLEVLLVNDGSKDRSEVICKEFCDRNACFRYLYQENQGVSSARNLGIKNATGKYIFFVDADDELAPGTISKVAEFFDGVYEETDLVTYPIETIYQNRVLEPHFRYQFLCESGVYDLREYPYIGQTTMNIVVKNKFENNILFDETQTFSEDQRYCCDVLHEKLKMGFCKDGKYIYYRSSNSSSGKLSGACYIFEQCTKFFEELFSRYDEVPLAFQGLYVNDIYWKMISNILFPYHYELEEYLWAINRLTRLLQRCDWRVVYEHPNIDFFEKFYLLRWMGKDTLTCSVTGNSFSLVKNGVPILSESSMEMVITKVHIHGEKMEIYGFLKTVFFQFYDQEPTLCVIENLGELTKKIPLYESAHSYYLSHEKTQKFYAMRYSCDTKIIHDMRFQVEVGGRWFPVHYYFMTLTPFSHKYKKYSYVKNGIKVQILPNNDWKIMMGQPAHKEKIWLYYDCKGVAFDNGALQFLHDINKADGIKRYYIVSDKRQKEKIPRKYQVPFGSKKHKRLILEAEKVITAYIEENNVLPFFQSEVEKYANLFQFEVIYLQHGVLHIDMPWKYTPEKILADYVVVSTEEEAEHFVKHGFLEEQLWKSRMPRFENRVLKCNRRKKILFAPTWRMYLTDGCEAGQWILSIQKFLNSRFYKIIKEFLDSEELSEWLKENKYSLDFKLHPIFEGFVEYFALNKENVEVISEVKDIDDYDVFITDFSSYLYDFLYINKLVTCFIPDIDEFKCGMNGYRNLCYDNMFWNSIATTKNELLAHIKLAVTDKQGTVINASFYELDSPMEEIYSKLFNQDLRNDF